MIFIQSYIVQVGQSSRWTPMNIVFNTYSHLRVCYTLVQERMIWIEIEIEVKFPRKINSHSKTITIILPYASTFIFNSRVITD